MVRVLFIIVVLSAATSFLCDFLLRINEMRVHLGFRDVLQSRHSTSSLTGKQAAFPTVKRTAIRHMSRQVFVHQAATTVFQRHHQFQVLALFFGFLKKTEASSKPVQSRVNNRAGKQSSFFIFHFLSSFFHLYFFRGHSHPHAKCPRCGAHRSQILLLKFVPFACASHMKYYGKKIFFEKNFDDRAPSKFACNC